MYRLIESFMNNLNVNQVNKFALNNNIELSDTELDFCYNFAKKNWQGILANPNQLNLERYKSNFTPENFDKIQKLLKNYLTKYSNYL